MKNKKLQFYKLFKPIAENQNLSDSEKLVVMYIYTLHSHGCIVFATNKEIAVALNLSKGLVSDIMKTLISMNLIKDDRMDGDIKAITICQNEICKSNYYEFPTWLCQIKVKPSRKILFSYIHSFIKDNKPCYTKNPKLNESICLSPSTVTRASNQLKALGMLEIIGRRSKYRQFYIPDIDISRLLSLNGANKSNNSNPKLDSNMSQLNSDLSKSDSELNKLNSDLSKSDSILSNYKRIDNKIHKKTNKRNYDRSKTENITSQKGVLLFNDVLMLNSTPENQDKISTILSKNSIFPKDTISKSNFSKFNSIVNFYPYLDSNNKIGINIHQTADTYYYSLVQSDSSDLILIDKPPFGFDKRLFHIHVDDKDINLDKEYISMESALFMKDLMNKNQLDNLDSSLESIGNLSKLNSSEKFNCKYYFNTLKSSLTVQ